MANLERSGSHGSGRLVGKTYIFISSHVLQKLKMELKNL